MSMTGILKGAFYGITFLVSVLLVTPVVGFCCHVLSFLPFLLLHKLIRIVLMFVLKQWLTIQMLVFRICGLQLHTNAPRLPPGENALVICNHRTRLDWLFLWSWWIQEADLTYLRIVMKATLAKAPIGIGRIVQCAMYAFLSRDFQLDGKYIQSICKYYRDSECGIQLLLFPEGTDLTANTKAKSHEFSKKNGLECWNQVLRPRSLGFVTFLNNLANDKPDAPQTTSNEEGRKRRESGGKSAVQAVYDLTIAYGPKICETEKDLFSGQWPENVYVLCKRYDIRTLTALSDSEKISWLNTRFQSKESSLSSFYQDLHSSQKSLKFVSAETDDKVDVIKGHAETKRTTMSSNLFTIAVCFMILLGYCNYTCFRFIFSNYLYSIAYVVLFVYFEFMSFKGNRLDIVNLKNLGYHFE